MQRVLWIATLLLATAGCQTQNPFAAIGPATVPAPTTGQTLPYYPPNVTGAPPANASAPATTQQPARVSVSAEGAASISTPRNGIVAEPADREPIRIVENNSPTIRTANAAARGAPATGNPAAPAARPPSGTAAPPPNLVPGASVPSGQPAGYAPPATSPATGRMRGFATAQPATSAGSTRSVAPANYQQAVPTFSEATPADGQWRAR